MAFNKYSNGAWSEPSTVKRYTNGAWADCESAKRYVSSAWQEAWSSAFYFLKAGVLMNGAALGEGGYQGSGSVYGMKRYWTYDTGVIKFYPSRDMIGKKLYIKVDSQITGIWSGVYLTLKYYDTANSFGSAHADSLSSGLAVFTVPDFYENENYVCIQVNASGGLDETAKYHFYDVYVK